MVSLGRSSGAGGLPSQSFFYYHLEQAPPMPRRQLRHQRGLRLGIYYETRASQENDRAISFGELPQCTKLVRVAYNWQLRRAWWKALALFFLLF
ncbi:hypothetical protein Peur_018843 [Populus x canadensis]